MVGLLIIIIMWPAFLVASCLNIGYMPSYALIRIHIRPHSNAYNIGLDLKPLYSLVATLVVQLF